MYGEDDPLRPVAAVVGLLAVLFAGLLVTIQLNSERIASVLTIPLLLAVPLAAALLYWYGRDR
jgi:tryptophan-rich sensory protein